MSTKSMIITAIAVAATLSAGTVSASEHGSSHGSFKMHSDHGHFEHSFHHQPHIRFIVRSNDDCGYYYERWQDTGSRYWKHKYYDCRG